MWCSRNELGKIKDFYDYVCLGLNKFKRKNIFIYILHIKNLSGNILQTNGNIRSLVGNASVKPVADESEALI